MGHHHEVNAAEGKAGRALALALALTGGFMVVEFAGGLWSGSLALLADAGHMLADSGSLGLALLAHAFARKPRTTTSTYGFRRAEVLAAFLNGIALAVVAIMVLVEALTRWFEPQPVRGGAMLGVAVAGLGVNVAVGLVLHRAEHANVNVRAAFAHVLSDALSSIGVIVAGVLVAGWHLYVFDALASSVISVLVAYSGWRVLRETTNILLEGVPPDVDVHAVEGTIRATPGVADLHDLHLWRVSDGFDALTVHVTVQRGSHGIDVCRQVALRLREAHGLGHVTVQPEAPHPDSVVPLRVPSRSGR